MNKDSKNRKRSH